MKQYKDIFKKLTLLTQLGLSVIMPLLLCLLGCMYLTQKTGIGVWIYIPGFILGLGSSFMTAYKFYKSVIEKDSRDKSDNKKVCFNKHI